MSHSSPAEKPATLVLKPATKVKVSMNGFVLPGGYAQELGTAGPEGYLFQASGI